MGAGCYQEKLVALFPLRAAQGRCFAASSSCVPVRFTLVMALRML